MDDGMAADRLAIRLLVGGPALCLVCGRTFTRGGAFDVPDLHRSPAVCMWCIAGWLEEMTGWGIVGQMRGWLVTRKPFGRKSFSNWRPPDVGDPANEQ